MTTASDTSQAVEAEDPRLGMIFENRYKIIHKLGEGGMGTVYAGEHLLIKRRVAIKCLHADLAMNEQALERFRREAYAATAIGHPHIIEVTDMGSFDDGAIFMVLEYLDGRPWSADIEDHGAQRADSVVHIARQVCDALGAAHDLGIIHRDLKPDNIFLINWGGDPDFVKLLDFGVAKVTNGALGPKGITKTGMILGTPYYMAPEQLEGTKDIDHRADIFSLGVLIFEALTGKVPFLATKLTELVIKICMEPTPPLCHYRPDLPLAFEDLISRMLAKDRDERPQSCADVSAQLARFASIVDAPVVNAESWVPAESTLSVATLPPTARPRRSSRIPLIIIGGLVTALVLMLALAAGLVLTHDTGPVESRREVPASPVAAIAPQEPPVVASLKLVALEISTIPAGADLTLDGRAVENPFRGQLAVRNEPHRVEAYSVDYERVVQEFLLTEPRRLELTLRPTAPVNVVNEAPTKTGPAESEAPPASVEPPPTSSPRAPRVPRRPPVQSSPPPAGYSRV